MDMDLERVPVRIGSRHNCFIVTAVWSVVHRSVQNEGV